MEAKAWNSGRIARKRTIVAVAVAVVGPLLQATIYNTKGFKHYWSTLDSSDKREQPALKNISFTRGRRKKKSSLTGSMQHGNFVAETLACWADRNQTLNQGLSSPTIAQPLVSFQVQ